MNLKHILNNAKSLHTRLPGGVWPPLRAGSKDALEEEFAEFLAACESGNHLDAAKELIDLIWVSIGYFAACFPRINHQSVMEAAYYHTNEKNAIKSDKTHVRLPNGHIVRRDKLEVK